MPNHGCIGNPCTICHPQTSVDAMTDPAKPVLSPVAPMSHRYWIMPDAEGTGSLDIEFDHGSLFLLIKEPHPEGGHIVAEMEIPNASTATRIAEVLIDSAVAMRRVETIGDEL